MRVGLVGISFHQGRHNTSRLIYGTSIKNCEEKYGEDYRKRRIASQYFMRTVGLPFGLHGTTNTGLLCKHDHISYRVVDNHYVAAAIHVLITTLSRTSRLFTPGGLNDRRSPPGSTMFRSTAKRVPLLARMP